MAELREVLRKNTTSGMYPPLVLRHLAMHGTPRCGSRRLEAERRGRLDWWQAGVLDPVWNIYRYATGILIVLILFRGGMVWWYLQVVLIL